MRHLCVTSRLCVPPACHQQVKHFDELQASQARAVKNLHAAINTKAALAAGNLAGASQK
jgi:hypothetical protein